MFKWLINFLKKSEPEQKPYVPEIWTVTMFQNFTDISWGSRVPSLRYEAISNKGATVRRWIYGSGMTREQLKYVLDKGKIPGDAL